MGRISLSRPTLGQVGRWVEVHPLELLRILVAENLLNTDLRFSTADITRIQKVAGLEEWWDELPTLDGEETAGQVYMRAVLLQMLRRNVVEPYATRADNLFRGLDATNRPVMRKSVNALIREGDLVTRMTGHGLVVTVPGTAADEVQAFLERRTGPLVEIWRSL